MLLPTARTSVPSNAPTITDTPLQTATPAAIETAVPTFTSVPSPTAHSLDQLADTILERSLEDRPDDAPGYFQVHVMYVIPHNAIDRKLDTNGSLNLSIAAIEDWLMGQTGGPRLRLDTYQGALDITFYKLQLTDQEVQQASVDFGGNDSFVRDVIERELRNAQLIHPQKLYAVYFDGLSTFSCGGGAWPPLIAGQVAALYLNGTPPGSPPCGSNEFTSSIDSMYYLEFAMLHEILHTLGFVATCGKNEIRAGHTSDSPDDLMWAGDQPWSPQFLDVNNDDYFKNGDPECLDLSTSVFLDPLPANSELPPDWGQTR